jgi:hypothetical protein
LKGLLIYGEFKDEERESSDWLDFKSISISLLLYFKFELDYLVLLYETEFLFDESILPDEIDS